MDVKAMARSKRSHTKHHQPRKPHRPTTQATPPSSSASKDPNVVKGEGEKKRSNLGSSLPSNWDRYHDSDEDEGLSGLDSASPTTSDLVKPKSKGADFGFLISQAKSQSPANFSDCFDGVLPVDFSQGLGSMLSVRGENILSWTGGDDFLMEDEATTTQEVPFLSLNLQTLAEELARIDLAQRLFIEEDILPPELRVPPKIVRDSKIPSASVEQSSGVDDLAFQNSSMVERRTVSKEGHNLQQASVHTIDQAPLSFRQERHLDDIAAAHKPKEPFKATQEAELDNKIPRFEAGAAEAELDMLLDSFDETKFFGSSNTDSSVPSAVSKLKPSASLFPSGDSLAYRAPPNDSTHLGLSTSSFPGNSINNDIDDLLQDTSYIAVGHAFSHSIDVNADTVGKQLSSSAHPDTKSKVMEDFDSWLDTL